MYNLSLTTCSFYLKKSNSKTIDGVYFLNDEIINMDKDGNCITTTIDEMFISFSENYRDSINDENIQKTFSCEYIKENNFNNEKYKFLTFKITSGYYGNAGNINNVETKEHKYTISPDDAVERDYYMFVVIPKDNDSVHVNKGLLIFQNISIFGVKTITTDLIRDFFSSNYNITLICANIAPKLFVDRILKKDNLKQMIMIKNHKSSLDTDNYDYGYGVESRIISKISFSDKLWESTLNKINDFINGKVNLYEFRNENYDKLKLKVDIGGRTRTIDLQNIDNLSVIESIPDEIKDTDGNANIKKLISFIKNLIIDYMKEMVLEMK